MTPRRRRISRITTTLPSLLVSIISLSSIFNNNNNIVSGQTPQPGGVLMGGFQSGPSLGAMYAGGMHFDQTSNKLYMTGSHYNTDLIKHDGTANDLMQGTDLDSESSCYVTMLDLNAKETFAGNDEVGYTFQSLTNWQSYGDPAVMETCSAITTNSKKDAFIVGSVEKGAFMHDDSEAQLVGVTAILNKEDFEFVNAEVVASATDDPVKKLLYPVAVLKSQYNDSFLYVAALTSTDDSQSKFYKNGEQPNWQSEHKYGTSYYLSVICYRYKPNQMQNLKLIWNKSFPVDKNANGEVPSVWIGGMLLQRDKDNVQHLLVAGSTRGTGEAYGDVEPGTDDEDGFIVQLRVTDGTFLAQKRHAGKRYGTNNLREGTGSDDLIRGICQASNSKEEFYIVGGTKGDMTTNEQGTQNDLDEVNAGFQFGIGVESKYRELWNRDASLMPFLRRVSFERDLGPVWTTQWAAMPSKDSQKSGQPTPTMSYAMDCAVDRNVGAVYVVGSVMKGAMMAQGDIEMINQGGDDVWVAKVDERTGNVYWLTQLGNYGDETPARHKSIEINYEGNVIIYGDTTSPLYRARDNEKETQPDMFVLILDGKTGAIDDGYYMGGTSSGTVAGSVDGNPKPVPQPPVVPMDGAPPGDDNQVKEITKEKTKGGGAKKGGMIFGILFAIVAVGVIGLMALAEVRKRKRAGNQKSEIFSCLQKFDVEDIDLRRSPPGGWHGTYMNKLAYGVNESESDGNDGIMVSDDIIPDGNEYDTKPLTNRGAAPPDSLFSDATKPSLSDGGYKDSNFNIDDDDDIDLRLKGKMA